MSRQSGDDLVAGEGNFAQDSTVILATVKVKTRIFGGDTGAVFAVGALPPFLTIPGPPVALTAPSVKLHAILGKGTNLGVGVIGLDSAIEKHDLSHVEEVGVFGNGDRAGVMGESSRGSGVEGIGGSSRGRGIATPGVLGRGGRQPDKRQAEKTPAPAPHGPGVYGIGGGRYELTEDDLIRAGNIGVFGHGAGEHFDKDGVKDSESASPGAGVAGRGGISTSGSVAPGVVGVSGRGAPTLGPARAPSGGMPIGFDVGDVGVHGSGAIGVSGFGVIGVSGFGVDGIKGTGIEGRGGIFQSEESAQLRLVPRKVPGARNQAPFAPSAITGAGHLLPETGLPGDLMAIADDKGECTLWFCVSNKRVRSRPRAHWAQVLTGPVVVGRTRGAN